MRLSRPTPSRATAPRVAAAPAARRAAPAPRRGPPAPRALELDWSDPDTIIGALGGVLGLVVGIGAPVFYASRDTKDEERLEELRALNRKTFEETGEYMTEEEIRAFRQPRWTDRREFVDDD